MKVIWASAYQGRFIGHQGQSTSGGGRRRDHVNES
jgi:hypothetical protein